MILTNLGSEKCAFYGFEDQMQTVPNPSYPDQPHRDPYLIKQTDPLVKATAKVLEKEACQQYTDWDDFVNDEGRFCAQIPSKKGNLTRVEFYICTLS